MKTFLEYYQEREHLLSEVAHCSLGEAGGDVTIKGVRGVDMLDMQFETYWFVKELRGVASFWSKMRNDTPFVAEIPGDPQGRFIIHRGYFDTHVGSREEAQSSGYPKCPKGWEIAADVMGMNGEYVVGAGVNLKQKFMQSTEDLPFPPDDAVLMKLGAA